jgi:threonine dehydrogenase-like Zn-dependent dehydrogenase
LRPPGASSEFFTLPERKFTLVGSRCGRFEAALPLLAHPLIHVDDLIAARFPLAEASQAFARAAERGVLKVLLE